MANVRLDMVGLDELKGKLEALNKRCGGVLRRLTTFLLPRLLWKSKLISRAEREAAERR